MSLVEKFYAEELIRRNQKVRFETPPQLKLTLPYINGLFAEQLALLHDPAKKKAAICGRRGGKSHVIAAKNLKVAEEREAAQILYLTLTRPSAKRIMWSTLKRFNRAYNLNLHFDNVELIATTPNHSQIYLAGANNSAEIEKFRGSPFDFIAIDEAASFGPYLKELIEEVLDPTLLDRDGELWLVGTGNSQCVGYFHDVTTGANNTEKWPTYHWTILNNPYMPHARQWLDKRMADMGWTEEHPVYRREWLGEWVRSLVSLVYRYRAEKCRIDTSWEPESHIIGVDLGYDDATVFVVWGFSPTSPKLRAVDCFKRVAMLPHQVAEHLKRFCDKYKPVKVKADTGGLGKAIVEEMKTRYGLQIEPADKIKKHDFIELMNSDFDQGLIEIALPECVAYTDELAILQWDEARKKEDPRYQNHACDGGLYGWREAKHWTYRPKEKTISPHSEEYIEQMWEREAEALAIREQEEKENDI